MRTVKSTPLPAPPPRSRAAGVFGAALLFLGLSAAVFAQTAPPVTPAPVVDATTGPVLPAGLTPPVPYPFVNRNPLFAAPAYAPAFKPGFGQALNTRPASGPSAGGAVRLGLPEGVFRDMIGSSWAVKFLVQTAVKGDFVTRTAKSPGTGQFLFGASRTTGTARAVLYPNGATPLVVDGGAGPDLSDGQPHWLEVDCAAGTGGTGSYYVYADGILAGSAVNAAAWTGPGAVADSDPNTPLAWIGDTAFDSGQSADYSFPCLIDELAFYAAPLHAGEAFTPDATPIASNLPHQTHLYHFEDLSDSNTNTQR